MPSPAVSEAEARFSGSRKDPRRARTPGSRPGPSRLVSSPAPSDASFRWRLLGGLLFLLLVAPFLAVSLASPELTGAAGTRVAGFLDFWLGRSAWLLPVLALALAFGLCEADPRKVDGLRWGGPVLLLDTVLLAARMGGQGGVLGSRLDAALVHSVGPAGAWLLAVGGLLGGLALLWQVTSEQVVDWLTWLGRILERVARLAARGMGVAFRAVVRFAVRTARGAGRGVASRSREGGGRARFEGREPSVGSSRPRPGPIFPESLEAGAAGLEPQPEGLPSGSFSSLEDQEPAPRDAAGVGLVPLLCEESFEEDGPPVQPEEGASLVGTVLSSAGEAADPAAEAHRPAGELKPPWSEESAEAVLPAAPGETVEVAPRNGALASTEEIQRGLLEEPGGQLRLFPAPPAKAAPPLRYRLPPLALLDDGPRNRRVRPLEDKSQLLVDTLDSFGVQARVVNVVHGPTVTRYELQPARGVKVSKFTSLTNDIALALAAVSVRIEAPIPGKSAIGIEVPNLSTELVVLKDLLSSETFRQGAGLCLGLGKDISGGVQVADLQKMPHLLVAGTTGSGKSVCVNTLILSLIYRFTPRRLQMLMVDPKQVELSIYEGLPHLVGLHGEDSGRILVDPKKAAMALKQVVDLMEDRYPLFARCRVRNLKEYNDQAEEPLPWMVVIIDELADLMMVASKLVETSICRLAQKARAAGIHMVVATQRPSTDVITGLIKVNIPSRIAFAVSSGVDSRVILDTGGAEHLLGKGDMLFLPVDASEPRRIQGAYVTNEEIQRVVEFWRDQAAPENRIELEVADAPADEALSEAEDDGDDDLVEEALRVVLRCQQASASMLQTELKVGYARARRILTILERKGYVGPAEGSKPRKILYTGGDLQ